jgi:hypothetical protein
MLRTMLLIGLLLAGAWGVPVRPVLASGHVCDCANGADLDCVPGADAASGSASEPWQSVARARAAFSTLAPGEAIRFCRGGAWDDADSAAWVNDACTAAAPCRVEAYSASWASGDESRPRLTRSAAGDAFSLANPGSARPQAGYRFADLHLIGNGVGQGFFLFNDIDDVTIERVRIENFEIGVQVAGANACGPDPDCDGRNERIVLRDSEIIGNSVQGWLGASSGTKLLFNLFDGNGSLAIFDHNVYLASEAETFGVEVIGNVLRNNTLNAQGRCSAASLVGHGRHTDLLIEGNLIEEAVGAAEPECWGLTIDPAYSSPEQFTRVVIRGNTVRNVGNLAIGTAACTDCIIENNQVIRDVPIGGEAIAVPNRALGAGDTPGTRVIVRNNSIQFAGPGAAIAVTTRGTGHQVVSNAIRTSDDGAGFACFDTDLSPSAFAVVDHNLCDPGTSGECARPG